MDMENYYNITRDFYYDYTVRKIYQPFSEFRENRYIFLRQFSTKVENHLHVFSNTSDHESEYKSIIDFSSEIKNSLIQEFADISAGIPELFEGLITEPINDHINLLPEKVIKEQTESHFLPVKKDNASLKIRKKIKTAYLPIYRTFNKKRRFWNREVPVKNISLFYFGYLLNSRHTEKLNYLLTQNLDYVMLLAGYLHEFENELFEHYREDKKEIIPVIEKFSGKVKDAFSNFPPLISREEFNEVFAGVAEEYQYSLDNCGTISDPAGRYSFEKTRHLISRLTDRCYSITNGFNEFFRVLTENVTLITDVLNACFFTRLEITQNVQTLSKDIVNTEIKSLREIASEIQEETKKYTPEQDLKLFLVELKRKYQTILTDEDAVKIIEKIPYSGIKPVADKYASYLKVGIERLKDEYLLVKLDELRFTSSSSKFSKFDPKDIINTLYFKDSSDIAEKFRKEIELKYQQAVKNIIECPDIVEFNIDTAIDVLDSPGGKSGEAKKIAFEGINRVIGKIEDAAKILDDTNKEYNEKFLKEIDRFILEFKSVLNVKKVTAVLLQLSKERTIEEIKKNFSIGWEKIVRIIPVFSRRIRRLLSGTKNIYGEISRRVGLAETAGEISAEISDYLLDVESNVSKLPKVYQRLFRYEPLADERFLVGRQKELGEVKSAFERWKHGHHASLALMGEKGAGTSTLLNFASLKFLPKKKILRTELKSTITSQEQLILFLTEFLELENISGEESLIESLKTKLRGFTIILENGEDLFRRVPSGFDAITNLLRLITLTSGEVFWIVTFNVYAWNFLTKTVNIPDYFTNTIETGRSEENLIEQIIMKRHSVSGYKIIFESKRKQKAAFYRQPVEQQQIELKKLYFESLNKLCEGNIALSLVFWLRSVAKFDQEVIYISDVNDLDFSFVKNLSDQKHFNLAAVLIHDGLTIAEYCRIFNVSSKEAELQLLALLDDGILFKRGERFKVNFLLYRQVVDSLKTKNILH